MAKAFEKVNPHWAVDVMLARGRPTWLVQYAMYLFTGRRVLHKVGGPPRIIRQGVDMGRAFSVFMFCLAMDPIYWHLNKIPGIVNVKGYVDDCTAVGNCGQYLAWLLPVRRLFDDLYTAGFQIVEHRCWKAIKPVPTTTGYPPAGDETALPLEVAEQVKKASGYPTCLAALQALQPRQGQPWPSTIVARSGHCYSLDGSALRLLEEGNTHQGSRTVFSLAFGPCKCKAQTALVTNTQPEPAHIITLE